MAVRVTRRTRATDANGRTVWLDPGHYNEIRRLEDLVCVSGPDGEFVTVTTEDPTVELEP